MLSRIFLFIQYLSVNIWISVNQLMSVFPHGQGFPDNCIPPRAKISGSYINSAIQKTEALINGFDEAVVLTSDGQHVSEAAQ